MPVLGQRLPLIVFIIFIAASFVHAGERYEFYNGVRGLGMGGARVAVVNDETALLVNPAGLGKLRDYFITLVDPEVALGAKTQSIIGYDIMAASDPQSTLGLLQTHKGKHLHQRSQIFPSFVVPNFGMGVFVKSVTDAEIDEAGTAYTYNYTSDYAFVLGYNFRLFDGRLKIGFNARAVNRTEIHRTDLDPNATGLTVKSLAQEGLGIASDVGLILTAPWKLLPTLGVVLRDAGGTHYNMQDGLFHNTALRPVMTEQSLDAALAIFPIAGKRTRLTFTAEYRDALTAGDETDHMRRTHAGFEVNVGDAFFFRAGMNQRYWTTGLEIAMFRYQLQLATYGEELGTAETPLEDRRYVGKFSYRF